MKKESAGPSDKTNKTRMWQLLQITRTVGKNVMTDQQVGWCGDVDFAWIFLGVSIRQSIYDPTLMSCWKWLKENYTGNQPKWVSSTDSSTSRRALVRFFQTRLTLSRSQWSARTPRRDDVFLLAWKCLRIPTEEVDEVVGERNTLDKWQENQYMNG